MLKKLKRHKILWLLIAIMALIAALVGVANPKVYHRLVDTSNLSGAMSQDLITIIAAIIMLFLVVRIKDNDQKHQLLMLGIIGYLFYGYIITLKKFAF